MRLLRWSVVTTTLHDDELPITDDLVRRLVDSQFPGYTDQPLRRLSASGSTNLLFRLGEQLLVRLPRQPGGGAGIDAEMGWPALVAPELPVPTPQIVAVGEPAYGYPERWAIVGWLDGALPTAAIPGEPADPRRLQLATDLADVIAALRRLDVPADAATDPATQFYRGRPLAEFDADIRSTIDRCRSITDLDLDLDAALALWEQALQLPGAASELPRRWYHGDLVAENLLLTDHRLSAVLDFNAHVGDPTIDLHGAWEILDPPARAVFRERLGVDEAEWLRGRAWALGIALGTFTYYWDTMPGRRHDRLAMAGNALADFSGRVPPDQA